MPIEPTMFTVSVCGVGVVGEVGVEPDEPVDEPPPQPHNSTAPAKAMPPPHINALFMGCLPSRGTGCYLVHWSKADTTAKLLEMN